MVYKIILKIFRTYLVILTNGNFDYNLFLENFWKLLGYSLFQHLGSHSCPMLDLQYNTNRTEPLLWFRTSQTISHWPLPRSSQRLWRSFWIDWFFKEKKFGSFVVKNRFSWVAEQIQKVNILFGKPTTALLNVVKQVPDWQSVVNKKDARIGGSHGLVVKGGVS